ncbi:MAG: hypothetical protein DRO67_06785 [Candidatus Asgardarchaeum californiense]|nr:MAG: hypothetical protein DRO67_06785 [Candidatus Asgardarchaeum californiense]
MSKLILGICGKARSGKDTFANYLIECFAKHHDVDVYRTAFADILKFMCKEHFNLSDDQLWGDKKEVVDKRFVLSEEENTYWTPRTIMQSFGEFYRSIDKDYWVKALDKHLKTVENEYVVITDLRYENECEYVKNNAGLLIRISRKDKPLISNTSHSSETSLDNLPYSYFDISINNDGSLSELYWAADNLVSNMIKLTEWINRKEKYNGS